MWIQPLKLIDLGLEWICQIGRSGTLSLSGGDFKSVKADEGFNTFRNTNTVKTK